MLITKKPRVGMIVMKGNPTSEFYRDLVITSWKNAGFFVEEHNAITPDTLPEGPLKFGKKSGGRNKGKDFTETEKAVWYSHYNMWKIASRKASPFIIIEHDVFLLQDIHLSEISRFDCLGLCHNGLLSNKPEKGVRISAGGAYMLTAKIAEKMIKHLPEEITYNSDAFIHQYISKYGAWHQSHTTQFYIPEKGTTIQHD